MSDTVQKRATVLGGLLNQADVNAKRVISTYDQNSSYAANKKALKKCNSTQLEACASFLGFTVRSQNQDKLYRNQEILADRVILKIESLFETECCDCSQTYHNTLDDTPLLSCVLCMQGSHNCDSIKDKVEAMGDVKPAGTAWLCFECLAKNNLALEPPQPKKVKNDAAPAVAPASVIDPQDNNLSAIPEDTDEREEEEDDKEDRESPRRNRG